MLSVDVNPAAGRVLSHEPLRPRLRTVDVVRGLAIAGVVLFHLVWDLDYAGLLPGDPARNPAWLMFGHVLAATFIALVGVSLALAHRGGVRWWPFFSRLVVIAAAAIAITIGTLLVFPDAFVFFGILHLIAAASLIGVLFVPLPAAASLLVGAAILLAPSFFSDPLFDTRWLAWIGFAETAPYSNDYVPIFPWAGFALLGLGLAKGAIGGGFDAWLARHEPDGLLMRQLGWLGRHTLIIYLVHQPLLLALILPAARLLA